MNPGSGHLFARMLGLRAGPTQPLLPDRPTSSLPHASFSPDPSAFELTRASPIGRAPRHQPSLNPAPRPNDPPPNLPQPSLNVRSFGIRPHIYSLLRAPKHNS